jgi:glutathione S-transferase
MKLYSFNLSPYASRVRLAIYAKGLPVQISPPPEGGMKTPEYLALNPMGKAPCLLTDGGMGVPESTVILEYLEDWAPHPPLMPASPEDRARVRLIATIAELYVSGPGYVLFGHLDPSKRDQAVVDAQIAKLDEGLGWLGHHVGDGAFALGDSLTLADCHLAPILFYLPIMAGGVGRLDLLERHPWIAAYMVKALKHPAVAKVHGEMTAAFAHFRETGQPT